VLPLSEDAEPAADDNLFKMEDVRIEVMRSRGAGGQVRIRTCFLSSITHGLLARQQNGVGGTFDTRAYGRDSIDAGRAESAPGSVWFLTLFNRWLFMRCIILE